MGTYPQQDVWLCLQKTALTSIATFNLSETKAAAVSRGLSQQLSSLDDAMLEPHICDTLKPRRT
ncbi:MAG: hypothetical protein ACKESB_03660 [Candidatus Hodgkinia cicadicola]